jgi:hypothetical protein
LIDVRAWLASASWACLCGIASSLFLTVSLVGLLVLFFGALLSAMLAPLLLLLPADWQWTGWQWLAIGFVVWLVVVCCSGAIARWAYFAAGRSGSSAPQRWPRTSSIIAGILRRWSWWRAFLVGGGFLPQGTPPPEPSRDVPLTV